VKLVLIPDKGLAPSGRGDGSVMVIGSLGPYIVADIQQLVRELRENHGGELNERSTPGEVIDDLVEWVRGLVKRDREGSARAARAAILTPEQAIGRVTDLLEAAGDTSQSALDVLGAAIMSGSRHFGGGWRLRSYIGQPGGDQLFALERIGVHAARPGYTRTADAITIDPAALGIKLGADGSVESADPGAGVIGAKLRTGQDRCVVCGALIKQVHGGQGMTWVHSATGLVAAADPPGV
jgi:hypothetical protein